MNQKEKNVQLLHRMPASLHRQLKIASAEKGISMTSLVVSAIQDYLNNIQKLDDAS